MNNPDWASEGQVFGTCEVSLSGHRGLTAEVVEMTLIVYSLKSQKFLRGRMKRDESQYKDRQQEGQAGSVPSRHWSETESAASLKEKMCSACSCTGTCEASMYNDMC